MEMILFASKIGLGRKNSMADMLVNLYEISEDCGTVKDSNIKIHRVLPPDASRLKSFIRENFNDQWVSEAEASLSRPNPTCYIAILNKEIVGFACYEATAPGMFGPTGVREDLRGKNVGSVLLMKSLHGLKELGYGYAIIGGVGGARKFYEKTCNALWLDMFTNSVYSRMTTKN